MVWYFVVLTTTTCRQLGNNTTYNYDSQAYNARIQASNFGSEAALADYRGASADPSLGIAGTLLSGAGSIADKWYKFDKEGVFK